VKTATALVLYRWSPQQLAATLKAPNDPIQPVSHETIYARPRGGLMNVADLMNTLLRQTPCWKTPNQALEEEIAKFNARVALAT